MVKVVVLKNFPLQAPILIFLAKVVHIDISPQDNSYIGAGLKQWTNQSNLVLLLQRINAEFDLEPPIPEALLQVKP
jgi:ubiquitin-protein ligase